MNKQIVESQHITYAGNKAVAYSLNCELKYIRETINDRIITTYYKNNIPHLKQIITRLSDVTTRTTLFDLPSNKIECVYEDVTGDDKKIIRHYLHPDTFQIIETENITEDYIYANAYDDRGRLTGQVAKQVKSGNLIISFSKKIVYLPD